jgi:hypothetical protein
VADCCEYSDEPSVSRATELVRQDGYKSKLQNDFYENLWLGLKVVKLECLRDIYIYIYIYIYTYIHACMHSHIRRPTYTPTCWYLKT